MDSSPADPARSETHYSNDATGSAHTPVKTPIISLDASSLSFYIFLFPGVCLKAGLGGSVVLDLLLLSQRVVSHAVMHDFTLLVSGRFLSLAWVIVFSFVGLPLLVFFHLRRLSLVCPFFSLRAFSAFRFR